MRRGAEVSSLDGSLDWHGHRGEFEGSTEVSPLWPFLASKTRHLPVQPRGICFGEEVKQGKEQVSGARQDNCVPLWGPCMCLFGCLSSFQALSKDILRSLQKLCFFFFPHKLEICGNPAMSKSIFFLTSSFVFNWGMYFVFETQCYCALNRLQSTVNIVLTGTGKPGNLWGLLCCDIRFSALVWNPTCSVSQLCLCSTFIHSVCVYPFIRSLSLCL